MKALLEKKLHNAAFTSEIDRQIIESFLKNPEAEPVRLTNEHLSREAIVKRLGELGLNKSFFALIKRDGVDPAARECLRCSKYFASLGAQNRLCAKCRKE